MKQWIAPFGLILALGCASVQLNSGAEKVRLVQTEPKGCKYLGEATGNQGNFFTGRWTSNANLETGARNQLKNSALTMGGNTVVLLTSRAGETGHIGKLGGSSQQTNVTVTGAVYDCP
ncbi:MAG: DUF4156 domain-containing protein [Elusimicrobia bacterium]|nr:DUF4156 domain-containing protein [Elusimicrobiota bacterium]